MRTYGRKIYQKRRQKEPFFRSNGISKEVYYKLHFLRDKDKREVDFLVVKNKKPCFLVEVKAYKNQNISKSLYHFQEQTGASHAFQISFDLPYVNRDCFEEKGPIIVPARTFLSQLI